MSETSFSLLERLQKQPDESGWQRLVDLYTPLIRSWLSRFPLQKADCEDLVQEVFATVVKRLPQFQPAGHPGSFRAWLRVLTVNRLREYWRAQQHLPVGSGDSDVLQMLAQLQEPANELTRSWDAEHDRHVVRRLLELIEPLFEPLTRLAFRRTVIDGEPAAEVAAQLGLSVNAVLLAKSRVLRQLRHELKGLLD